MKDSATNITLGIGWVVTALTLSTTCFLTVNAVLAYVRGDERSIALDRANEDPIVPAVLASRSLVPAAEPEPAISVTKAGVSDSTQRRVSAVMTRRPAYIPEPRQESSISIEPVVVPSPEAASTGATAESPPPRQEQARVPELQPTMEAGAVASANAGQAQCGEASLAGAFCREAVRWNTCHPEGWNKSPECAVQQFDVFMQ
jgi:hypothetical protein